MKFKISGIDQESGQNIELVVEANDVPTAVAVATRKGIDVSAVQEVAAAGFSIPTQIHSDVSRVPPIKKQTGRLWLILLVVIASLMSPFYPLAPLWLGITALGLVLFYLTLSPVRKPLGVFLRVSAQKPARRVLKLSLFIFVGVVLVWFSSVGREMIRYRTEYAATQKAERLAREQIEAEAVARVSTLVDEAKGALVSGKISEAESLLDEAIKTSDASNRGIARTLRKKIQNSTDSAWVLTSLANAPDEEFARFQAGGDHPSFLNFGFKVLTDRAIPLAHSQIDLAATKRDELKHQAEESRRRIEEAAETAKKEKLERIAAEQKKIKDKAAAQAAAEAAEKAKFEKTQGETLHVGYTSYCAWDSHWSQTLSANQFLNKRANASWLFVNITIRNNDKKARMVPPITLVDEEGREYQSSTEGTMIENSIGVLESLNPDVSVQGFVVFDVPKGRNYKLVLSGGYWSDGTGHIRLEPTEK